MPLSHDAIRHVVQPNVALGGEALGASMRSLMPPLSRLRTAGEVPNDGAHQMS